MRNLPTAIAAHLAARRPMMVRQGLWFVARNRTTGAAEPLGLWTGEYDATFAVAGQDRLYRGAGGVLEIPEMTLGIGLDVRSYVVTVSRIAAAVGQLLDQFEARLATCEVHAMYFDPEAPTTLLAAPVRKFVGWVDEAVTSESPDGSWRAALTLASQARGLTVAVQAFRSDETYRAQRGGDRIGRYCSAASAPVQWGQGKGSAGGRGGSSGSATRDAITGSIVDALGAEDVFDGR